MPSICKFLHIGDKHEQSFDGETKKIKQKFTKARGYRNEEGWGQLLRLDPHFFETYTNLSSKPWLKGVLPPKIKEFIYIAIDASCTHLYPSGTRVHIQNALKYGATKEEIMGRTPDPRGGEKGSCHEATQNVPYRV
jgi:alkylhydroperoxidase/carboxymuconolactone decarboxylase family protein YurZ